MSKPLLLDLFCCAGGAAKGYHNAGFDVVGMDIEHQPNYPYTFTQGDVTKLDLKNGPFSAVRAIHASPPCQAYSYQTQDKTRHTKLIHVIRDMLEASDLPYVIENVEGAKKDMTDPVRLCGSSFGLDVRRHRLFETNWDLKAPPCNHAWQTPRFRSLNIKQHRAGQLASVVGVHGHLNYPGEQAIREKAMGINWMTVRELAESIPPAYTEHIGKQLIKIA